MAKKRNSKLQQKRTANGARKAPNQPRLPAKTPAQDKEVVIEGKDDGKPAENKAFSIVGIGASAGGYEAFVQLLEHLPEDTGMAFVLVQHLDPKHESKLSELLSRSTRLALQEAGH